MKKFLALITAVCILALGGCAKVPPPPAEGGKLKVVTTIFPPYDFAREIGGKNAEVTQLLPAGSESHNYEPTLQDLSLIANCDIFIYVGGEIDPWAESAIAGSHNEKRRVIKLLDVVGGEHHHKEGEEHHHKEGEEHSPQSDEHIWTSPENAMEMVKVIADNMIDADGGNSAAYKENRTNYLEKLMKLQGEYSETIKSAKLDTVVFADRFPFAHLCESYNLKWVSALPGCSSDTEPTLTAVKTVIDTVKEKKISAVLYTETADGKIAQKVTSATGCGKKMLHSCHNLTEAEIESGENYLTLMEENLKVLKEVLN